MSRIVVGRDKEFKGIAYVYDKKVAAIFENNLRYDRIAELDVEDSDIIYVASTSDDLVVDGKIVDAVPDFLFNVSVLNVTTDLNKIIDDLDLTLKTKNVIIKAFIKKDRKYIAGCTVLLEVGGNASIAFRSCSMKDFAELVKYYEGRRFGSVESC